MIQVTKQKTSSTDEDCKNYMREVNTRNIKVCKTEVNLQHA